jgi:hypothetical protein
MIGKIPMNILARTLCNSCVGLLNHAIMKRERDTMTVCPECQSKIDALWKRIIEEKHCKVKTSESIPETDGKENGPKRDS